MASTRRLTVLLSTRRRGEFMGSSTAGQRAPHVLPNLATLASDKPTPGSVGRMDEPNGGGERRSSPGAHFNVPPILRFLVARAIRNQRAETWRQELCL